MKRSFLTSVLVFSIMISPFCQTKEYDLIGQIKNSDSSTTVVYLNATWCYPCMAKLSSIIRNFGKNPSVKLIVLFDRSGFENYKSRLFELYDSSYFRLFLKKYYASPNRLISIKVNEQNKIFKRFLEDYNKQLSTNVTIKDLWFGHAVIIKNKIAYITKSLEEDQQISEIESKIKEE